MCCILFSLPICFVLLQTLYGMADLFIIGQFEGVASTTAVSIGSQVMHMITVMIVGLAMGATVTIGRAVGAENKPVRRGSLATQSLFMAGSVVLAAVLVGLVDPIVRIVSTPEQAVAGTRTYLIICFIGVPCITAYNIMASIFRGLGDSRSPMYFIAAGLCLASLAVVNEKEYILVTLGGTRKPRDGADQHHGCCAGVPQTGKKNDCFANSTASRLCGNVRSGTMEPQTELLAHKEDKTMYELNKTAFGSFLAQLRREGMTRRSLPPACMFRIKPSANGSAAGVPDISCWCRWPNS